MDAMTLRGLLREVWADGFYAASDGEFFPDEGEVTEYLRKFMGSDKVRAALRSDSPESHEPPACPECGKPMLDDSDGMYGGWFCSNNHPAVLVDTRPASTGGERDGQDGGVAGIRKAIERGLCTTWLDPYDDEKWLVDVAVNAIRAALRSDSPESEPCSHGADIEDCPLCNPVGAGPCHVCDTLLVCPNCEGTPRPASIGGERDEHCPRCYNWPDDWEAKLQSAWDNGFATWLNGWNGEGAVPVEVAMDTIIEPLEGVENGPYWLLPRKEGDEGE